MNEQWAKKADSLFEGSCDRVSVRAARAAGVGGSPPLGTPAVAFLLLCECPLLTASGSLPSPASKVV